MKRLYVVGFGCGSAGGMTLEARAALEESERLFGYTTYIRLLSAVFPDKRAEHTGMRGERERVLAALSFADAGHTAALVCSGDAAVYGMAGLTLQLAERFPEVEVRIVPGVTAALSGGAVLGAPLTHDFAVISLSDLLTPMERIEKRLMYAAMADLVIVLYNPSSRQRPDHLRHAGEILLAHRSPDTVCGIVRNIGREGQESRLLTLSELSQTRVDMFTTVYIGNHETCIHTGRMVTPRGYADV